MAYSECLTTRLNPLAERTRFSQANLRRHGVVAELFYELDADASGFLEPEEVLDFCDKLGLNLSVDEGLEVSLLHISYNTFGGGMRTPGLCAAREIRLYPSRARRR